jgi:hypothetical protein
MFSPPLMHHQLGCPQFDMGNLGLASLESGRWAGEKCIICGHNMCRRNYTHSGLARFLRPKSPTHRLLIAGRGAKG